MSLNVLKERESVHWVTLRGGGSRETRGVTISEDSLLYGGF